MAFPVELGLILLFSILGGVLAVRFRQPSVLGLIIIGAIVGPYNLGIVKDTSLINASIEIGAILLLFTVGVEFSLQKLLNLGLRAVVIAVVKLGLVFLISYYTSILLGFDFIAGLYIGIILSITSTVIFIKVLDQKGMYKREETSLLIAILIIEDIFGVFALAFFSGLNTKADLSPFNLLASLLISLTVLLIAYLILQRALKPVISWLIKYSTEDTTAFLSLGLCGAMSYIALLLNLSPSVGAFLAGNIVASLPNSKIFERAIHPFILAFTSLFFFSIGTTVNFSVIIGSAGIILALFAVNVLAKFLAIGSGSYIFTNFTGKQAVFSGIAMLSVGEFSLLIAKESQAVVSGIDLVSITAAIILLSSLAMSLLAGHADNLYSAVLKLLPSRVKEDMSLTSKFLNSISWSMLKDRVNSRRVSLEWKTILNNLFILFFMLSAAFFVWRHFRGFIVQFIHNGAISYAAAALLVIFVFYPLSRVIKNLSHLLSDFYRFFVKISPKEVEFDRKIFRDIVMLCVFFIILVIVPNFFAFFNLDPIYNFIVIALLAAIGIYVYKASRLIHEVVHKHSPTFNRFSKKYKLLLKKRMHIKSTGNNKHEKMITRPE